GPVEVPAGAAADLADVEAARPPFEVEPRRTMHVGPLRLVLSVPVEDLDTMVLPVGDVHPAVAVAADIMGNVELAGIGARLAPRQQQRAVRRKFVDARVAIAV